MIYHDDDHVNVMNVIINLDKCGHLLKTIEFTHPTMYEYEYEQRKLIYSSAFFMFV